MHHLDKFMRSVVETAVIHIISCPC